VGLLAATIIETRGFPQPRRQETGTAGMHTCGVQAGSGTVDGMYRTLALAFAFILLVSGETMAQTTTALVLPDDPAVLLGLNPAQAIERFGAPTSVFAIRGTEAWQDDVVFDYGGGFSLFLFKDRVWQIRVAKPYASPVLGFVVGTSKERAASALGSPVLELAGAVEWNLPGEAWPVRLRGIVDEAGLIPELYVYRADF